MYHFSILLSLFSSVLNDVLACKSCQFYFKEDLTNREKEKEGRGKGWRERRREGEKDRRREAEREKKKGRGRKTER